MVWMIRNQSGLTPPDEAGPKAKAAALQAIELDGNSAGAYEALASVKMLIDWDWDGAAAGFRRALEINPNLPTAQGIYAHLLLITGHAEEALAHSKRSVDLDPFNPLTHVWYSFLLYAQGRNEEALDAAREALRLQPDNPVAMSCLAFVFDKKGMPKEAFEATKAYAKVGYNDPKVDIALDKGYAQGGYAGAMKGLAEALVARLPETYALPFDIAGWYALAGEKEKAIEWLEKGLDPHDPVLPYIGCYRCFDDLHSDPRFQALLRKMRLPTDDKKR
jgi:tetratricopeptide (TPR) repeat protein